MAKRRKKKKFKQKVRAHIQGRTLLGQAKVHAFGANLFAYKGEVYDIDDLPEKSEVNLDTMKIPSMGKWEKKSKSKKKRSKGYRKKFQAHLVSNLENCPDVQAIIEEPPS